MKHLNRSTAIKAGLMTAAAFAVSIGAAAAQSATTCTRGGDSRTIEVLTPGKVGESCDVRYARSATNISTPYHADTSDAFCNEKARVLVNNLAQAGFTCVATSPSLRAETAPAADYVVEARRPAPPTPSAAPAPEPAAAEEAEESPTGYVATDEAFIDTPQAAAPVVSASMPENDPALADSMSQILEQPAAAEAPRQPAQLVAQQADVAGARPQPAVVGRLVGAAPEAPKAAVAPTNASLQTPPAAQPQTQGDQAQSDNGGLRAPRDLIKATLLAQVAAWNEGNLDAFMNTYWKSDDLKMVSGTTVTKGWSSIMKHYRDAYANDSGLGQLSMDKLDTKLITDDVAVVTGRFAVTQDDATGTGSFSLVMRRDNGVWRIVHDHTTADPATSSD